jgi:predicted transposase YbfD/YdcC
LWLPEEQDNVAVMTAGQVEGLLVECAKIPDWRDPRGVRFPLASVIALWVAGNIASHDKMAAIWQWARALPPGVVVGFGLARGVPSERTFRRLIEEGPSGPLDEHLSGWIAAAMRTPDAETPDAETPDAVGTALVAVAFDGKVLKGARSYLEDGSMRQEAVVEAARHDLGVVVGHERVVAGDEIAAVKALVARVCGPGMLVTTDCLHSHEPLARAIRAKGGHWLFSIKGNQPTIQANLAALPWGEFENLHVAWDKAHGRLEERALKVLTPTSPVLVGFWGTRQVVKIARTTRRKKTTTSTPATSTEEFYLVTSLTADQASPADLARWARGHWTVEAVHYVRDMTMDEDRHTIRTKNAALNWAIVRDTTISALRLAGYTRIAETRRDTARDLGLVLQIIATISKNRL